MERKTFLELCQQAAVYPSNNIKVRFAKYCYTPHGYKLTFDSAGHAVHTAILIDKERNCYMYAVLDKVEEVK